MYEGGVQYDQAPGDRAQIYAYTWRPADPETAPPILGLPEHPPVGTWWVSPALAERMAASPELRSRYPHAGIIGDEGLAHPRELIAHRIVGPGASLDERFTAGPAEEALGDGTEVVDAYPIVLATIGLVGVPVLGIVTAALAPLAESVAERLAVLRALGASPRTRRHLVVAQAVVVAAPGALSGAAGWAAVSPRLTVVPFVGRPVFAGDLGLGALRCLVAAAAVVALVVVAAVARPRWRRSTRPTVAVARRPSVARVLPLALGLAMCAAGARATGSGGARLFLAGILASAAGAALSLPVVLDRIGARIATGRSALGLLVGRRLSATAQVASRALLALTTVCVLLPVLATWVGVARIVDPVATGPLYPVVVTGVGSADEQRALERVAGVPALRVVADDGDDTGPGRTYLVGDCQPVAALVDLPRCDGRGFAIPDTGGLAPLADMTGVATAPPGTETESLVLIGPDSAAIEARVRTYAANGAPTALGVTALGRDPLHESPLVAWIMGGARLALTLGAVALVLHLAGWSARTARTRQRLRGVGADRRTIRALAAGEAGLGVLVAGVAALAVGVGVCGLFVLAEPRARPPIAVSAVILGGIVAMGVVVGAGAAAGGGDGAG